MVSDPPGHLTVHPGSTPRPQRVKRAACGPRGATDSISGEGHDEAGSKCKLTRALLGSPCYYHALRVPHTHSTSDQRSVRPARNSIGIKREKSRVTAVMVPNTKTTAPR